MPADGDRRVAYVCALAYAEPGAETRVFTERCEGELADEPRGDGGFGYDPAFVPRTATTGARWPSCSVEEKDAISHRGRAARAFLDWLGGRDDARAGGRAEPDAAAQDARGRDLDRVERHADRAQARGGRVTGSIAIITEAIHSGIDLMASMVAYFSVRKADEPPDESHPYGHEKVENVAAGIEGMLILVGAGIIIYESVRRLVDRRRASRTSASASR